MSNDIRITREVIEQMVAEAGGAARLDLSDQDLSGLDLSYLDLSRARLSGVNLQRATLTQTRLRGANLSAADLSEAELNDADLSAADLSGAILRGANLAWAVLRSAYLLDTDFRQANLTEARLDEADLRSARLQRADLSGASLQGVEASGVDLTEALLITAERALADLSGANLYKARLTPAQFNLLDEAGVNLDGVEVVEPPTALIPTRPIPAPGATNLIRPDHKLTLRLAKSQLSAAQLAELLTTLNRLHGHCVWLATGQLAAILTGEEITAELVLNRLEYSEDGQTLLELESHPVDDESPLTTLLGDALEQIAQPLPTATAVLAITENLVSRLSPQAEVAMQPLVVQALLPDLLRFQKLLRA